MLLPWLQCEGYETWVEYIDDVPNLTGLKLLPIFHADYQLLGTAGVVFLGVAGLGAILSDIFGFYMATSRLLYSMANERGLPKWFGELNKQYKTPAHSIVFVLVITLSAPILEEQHLDGMWTCLQSVLLLDMDTPHWLHYGAHFHNTATRSNSDI